jgi:hypothetical protein
MMLQRWKGFENFFRSKIFVLKMLNSAKET